jgi:hypothetical protein
MHRNQLPIATPCNADWNAMTPADGGRFCGDCKKVVRDLARMTRDEAQEMLAAPDRAELCVRYIYDAQGKVFFREAQANMVPANFLHRAKRAALTAAAMSLAACSDPSSMFSDPSDPGPGVLMGAVAIDVGERPRDADAGSDADAQAEDATPSTDAGADTSADASPDASPDGAPVIPD